QVAHEDRAEARGAKGQSRGVRRREARAGHVPRRESDLRQMQIDTDPAPAAREADEVVALTAADLERRLLDEGKERREQRVLRIRKPRRAGSPTEPRVVGIPEVPVLRLVKPRR